MSFFEVLLSRRSIRAYTPEPVSDSLIDELLHAAMSAPSAGNQKPWHFLVIRHRETLAEVARTHPYAKMAGAANAAILVCGDESLETHQGYWVQDCSAATENLLLAAHAKGLGAVWVGIYPRLERVSKMRELCGIPLSVTPFALVPLGYPAEQKGPGHRLDKTRVHYDRWRSHAD